MRFGFLSGTSLARFASGYANVMYERVILNNRFGNAHVAALGLTLPY